MIVAYLICLALIAAVALAIGNVVAIWVDDKNAGFAERATAGAFCVVMIGVPCVACAALCVLILLAFGVMR